MNDIIVKPNGMPPIEPMLKSVADKLLNYSLRESDAPKLLLIINEVNMLADFDKTQDGAMVLDTVSCLLLELPFTSISLNFKCQYLYPSTDLRPILLQLNLT